MPFQFTFQTVSKQPQKASAIVTDLGGMTSHAAIVSREMEIPCIVGTDTATKILKDGDYVLVDAMHKGEVIKLKPKAAPTEPHNK